MAACAYTSGLDKTLFQAYNARTLAKNTAANLSPISEMTVWQQLGAAAVTINNAATANPAMRPYAEAIKTGEEVRSRLSHEFRPTIQQVQALSEKDSEAITKMMEAEDAQETLATENADGSATITATQDHVGLRNGETYTLSPKLNTLRKDIRKVLDTIYDNVIKATKVAEGFAPDATIDQIRQTDKESAALIQLLEDSRIKAYIPHVRSGRYAAQFTINGEVHVEGYNSDIGKSGKTKAEQRIAEVTKQGATNARIRDLQMEGELLDTFLPPKGEMFRIDALFQALLTPPASTRAGLLSAAQGGQASIDLVKTVIKRLKTEAAMRGQQRLRKRKGNPGWLRKDNYDTYLRATIPAYASQMSDFIANKSTEATRQEAIANAADPKIKKFLLNHEQYLHSNDAVAARLKAVGFNYTIGGNLSSAATQTTQLWHTTIPFLAGIGGVGTSVTQTMRAIKDVSLIIRFSLDPTRVMDLKALSRFAPDEQKLIEELFASGSVEPVISTDQAGAFLGRTQSKQLYALGRGVGKVLDALSLSFQGMEQFNRLVTGLAAYRMAKNPAHFKNAQDLFNNLGIKVADATDIAKETIRETQFVMGKSVRAQLMQGTAGGVLLQFVPFTIAMLGFQRRALQYYGGKGILSTDVGKKVLFLHLLAVASTAGLLGLPFMLPASEVLEQIYNKIAPEFGMAPRAFKVEFRGFLRELFEELPFLQAAGTPSELAEYVISGPARILGVDLSRRTALEVIDENMLNLDILNMGPVLSAVFGGAKDAVEYAKRDMPLMAIASLFPVAFRNAARAATMTEVGYISPGKITPALPASEVSDPGTVISTAIGFTPTKVARARETLAESKDLAEKTKDLRESYSNKIATALARAANTSDPAEKRENLRRAQDLRREVSEFDRGKPLRDRIVQNPSAFQTSIQEKFKDYLRPQRPDVVPPVARPYYAERLRESS